jgi:hypothetical protein
MAGKEEYMENTAKITCPNCGSQIDVSSVLRHQLEAEMKKDFEKEGKKHSAEVERLIKENEGIRRQISEEKEKEYGDKLKGEREKMRQEAVAAAAAEREDEVKMLKETLKQKSEQVIELNKSKAQIAMLKMEKDELAAKIGAQKDEELGKRLKAEREAARVAQEAESDKIRREAEEKQRLVIDELKKKLADTTAAAAEMQRKAEQGSMQLQGEVQELAIEDVLRTAFPFDAISEVKKGVRGADVIHTVRNRIGADAGIIAYESKRTKTFSDDWIPKLKADGALVKADICVLVTEAMPDGIERVGLRDGVWICAFSAFGAVALILRENLIKLNEAYASQTNKGEKMQMLYDYLIGNEFQAQIGAVVGGFMELQKGYTDERFRMEKIWKEREMQLRKVLLNVHAFAGSVKGIAGSSMPEIPALEDRAGRPVAPAGD